MGATVQGARIASKTIQHDDDVPFDLPEHGGGVPSLAFASMGTGPSAVIRGGSGHVRLTVTTGTGTPAIAANNVQITCSRPPRKVFLAGADASAPKFHVASISGNVINIGTKVAPAASTAYDLELVVMF